MPGALVAQAVLQTKRRDGEECRSNQELEQENHTHDNRQPTNAVAMTGAPEQFRPFDGPAGAGLRQEWSQLRAYVGLTDPRGEVVDDVCLRTVLPQAQSNTSRATAASRLLSITDLHNGSSPLKRA